MKNLFLAITLLCAATSNAQTKIHKLDTEKSVLNWKGYYMFKFAEHVGTVQFKSGQLVSQSGNITGGSFVIDMTSITNEDYELHGDGPVKHLKNKDFFDVPKYPEATLDITKVEYFENDNSHRLNASLTIKGISKPVKFYGYVDDTSKTMKAKLKIDRMLWGISYNNKLKDETISDAIEFDVFLQFK